jgi:dienelactone hydrolase
LIALMLAAPVAAQEAVSFPSDDAASNADGAPTEITAVLHKPDRPSPWPAVVLLHGCSGVVSTTGRAPARDAWWTERLRREGYAVLVPDSFGPRGHRQVCTLSPSPVREWHERRDDARGAHEWLQARPDVIGGRIALMGWSHGGGTVLATAPDGRYRAAVAYYPGCATARGRPQWASHAPLLVLVGEADDWTPARFCKDLAARGSPGGRPIELVSYPGAHHGFDTPGSGLRTIAGVGTPSGTATTGPDPDARAQSRTRVLSFLAAHLKH